MIQACEASRSRRLLRVRSEGCRDQERRPRSHRRTRDNAPTPGGGWKPSIGEEQNHQHESSDGRRPDEGAQPDRRRGAGQGTRCSCPTVECVLGEQPGNALAGDAGQKQPPHRVARPSGRDQCSKHSGQGSHKHTGGPPVGHTPGVDAAVQDVQPQRGPRHSDSNCADSPCQGCGHPAARRSDHGGPQSNSRASGA
jgi:hypothetical protein